MDEPLALFSGRKVTSKQFLWQIQKLTVFLCFTFFVPLVPWDGTLSGSLEQAPCLRTDFSTGGSWIPSPLELQLGADR